jgi:hypothetical protein
MNLSEIVQKAIPGINDEMIDYIIFNRTPYPLTKPSAREVYRAATRWQRARVHGIMLCELCDNEARQGDWVCTKCDRMLHTQQGDDK